MFELFLSMKLNTTNDSLTTDLLKTPTGVRDLRTLPTHTHTHTTLKAIFHTHTHIYNISASISSPFCVCVCVSQRCARGAAAKGLSTHWAPSPLRSDVLWMSMGKNTVTVLKCFCFSRFLFGSSAAVWFVRVVWFHLRGAVRVKRRRCTYWVGGWFKKGKSCFKKASFDEQLTG